MKALVSFLAVTFIAASTAFSGDFPKGSPKFKSTLSAALGEAKKDGKPVIAIFSAVWAYLDADASSNQAGMKKFGVSGIPHIEFLDKDGKSVGKQVGSASADSFAKTLEEMLKKAGGSSGS